MQLTVQESVQDVILMAHLQQPIAGLQQLPQHVLPLVHQNVPTVAKQRALLHWDIHLVQRQHVQPHKLVLVQDVVQQLLRPLVIPGLTHVIPHVTVIVLIQEL